MTELLAPAGDLEKLEWAVEYGADAVYFGMQQFSLRNFAGNFSVGDAENGLRLLHSKGKKGYITLNIYPNSNEYADILRMARELEDIKADAFIVSDIGLISVLKKEGIKVPIHISTQANTMSYQTILAYKDLGAKRVNLARELSLEQIKEIQTNLKGSVETEVFIHGAVCFSYSGRCAISDYMTGRKANRGECTHPCRWRYYLMEETREGEFYPVFEDNRGLYFFNNKDLALFPYIKQLMACGVDSFKIEGRMKTIHYIASVVSLYRRIIDGENIGDEQALALLSRVNNRGYSHGFMKGGIEPSDYSQGSNQTNSTSIFVANYLSKEEQGTVFRVRNRIVSGDTLEMLSPDGKVREFKVPGEITKKDGTKASIVQNEDQVIFEGQIPAYSILRKIKEQR